MQVHTDSISWDQLYINTHKFFREAVYEYRKQRDASNIRHFIRFVASEEGQLIPKLVCNPFEQSFCIEGLGNTNSIRAHVMAIYKCSAKQAFVLNPNQIVFSFIRIIRCKMFRSILIKR